MFEFYLFKPFSLFVLYSGVIADIVLGDRDRPWHPIRIMGAAISFSEKRAMAYGVNPLVSGIAMSVGLTISVYLLIYVLVFALGSVSLFLSLLFSGGCIYFSLCLRCLADEATKVLNSLCKGDLAIARYRLSMLVSRDTQNMDKTNICRSLIETVSENLVDGIYSPFFYAMLGGPAMCMAFKMISSLDSMVGYRNTRYEQLGKAAAYMDDAANYIPARLSAFVISVAGLLVNGSSPLKTVKGLMADARLHKSPNSGFPESAFAYTLDVRLGGPVMYEGVLHKLPYLNKGGRAPDTEDVRRSIRLLYASAGLFYAIPVFLVILI